MRASHLFMNRASSLNFIQELFEVILVLSSPEIVVRELFLRPELIVVHQVVGVLSGWLQTFLSLLQVLTGLVILSGLDVRSAQAVLVESLEKSVDGVFIGEVVIIFGLFALLRGFFGSSGVFKLAVPDFLNLVDLVSAEHLPALHLDSLDKHLGCHVFVITLDIRVLVVQGSLGKVAQLESNLGNLAHVNTTGGAA